MILTYLYIVQLLIRPQDFSHAFLGWPVAWLTVLPGFLFGLTMNNRILSREKMPQYYLLPLFLAVIALSALFNAGMGSVSLQVSTFLKRALVFYMIILLLDDEQKIVKVLWLFMISAGLLGVHAVLQLNTGTGFGGIVPLLRYNPPRAVWCGEWDGSNSFGVIFLLAIPVCLEFLFSRIILWQRLLAGFFLPFILLGLYYVDSRGDTLAAIVTLLLYVLMKFPIKKAAVVFIAAIAFSGIFLPARMAFVSSSESSAHQRTWVWEQGLHLLKHNPLLGVGPGRFVQCTESGLIAHSNYVSIFSETGLLGFFIFISLIWFSFKGLSIVLLNRNGIRNTDPFKTKLLALFSRQKETASPSPDFSRALFCSFAGLCAASFFIVLLNDLLFLFLGLCAASFAVSQKENGYEYLLFSRNDARAVFIIMAGIIGLYWLIAIKEIF